jgi:hypothetical protein
MNDASDIPANGSPEVFSLGSREKAVECPHLMTILAYLGSKYQLPKHAFNLATPIYHYTDAAGLLGIISTNRIWATDVSFLNDPSEGRLFPEHFIECMRQKPGGLTSLERKIIEEIANGLELHASGRSTYGVSFCGEGDLLSQWRGYGSFGSGYAVGVDARELVHLQVGHLITVQYGFSGVQTVALDILSIFAEAATRLESVLDSLCRDAAYALFHVGLGFKDKSYEEEQETRIITFASDKPKDLFPVEKPLKFRARGADVVPYIDLAPHPNFDGDRQAVPRLPIRRIVTGPGVDFPRNRSSLERLLEAHGYVGVEIVPSAIPFRP